MDPDIVRMYSSSPPPMDEGGEEEDEDEFGDFGGYGGNLTSSFSFSEFDTPESVGQSHVAETSPPELRVVLDTDGAWPGKDVETVENREKVVEKRLATLQSQCDLTMNCEDGNPTASGFLRKCVLQSDPQRELSATSNTGQHSPASTSVLQDSECSRSATYLNKGHGDMGAAQERTIMANLCSTQTEDPASETEAVNHNSKPVLATKVEVESFHPNIELTSEPSIGPCHLSSSEISQRELSNSRNIDAEKGIQEFQNFRISEGQERMERKKEEDEGAFFVAGGSSDEDTFCPCGEVQSHNKSEDSRDDIKASASGNEADIVFDSQDNEDFKDCDEIPIDPMVKTHMQATGIGVTEVVEEANRNPVCHNVDATQDVEPDKPLSRAKTNSVGPAIEDLGDAAQGFADFSYTESMQEGFADFVTAMSGCSTDDEFADNDSLKDLREDAQLPEEVENNDESDQEQWCSELPPSDSFADFTSAPLGSLAGNESESWASFGSQGDWNRQESWAVFNKDPPYRSASVPPSEHIPADNVLLNCKLQPLFQSTFHSEATAEVKEVSTLQALLDPEDHREDDSHPAQGEAVAMWRHLVDIHSSHGLKFQWLGSRSNRILLDCLGIRNILFTGQKKHPVIVPMFAAGMGMLEPTKDPVKSPTSLQSLTSSSLSQSRSSLCTHQIAPSWNIGEDESVPPGGAVSQLNLDFFGTVDDCSSDSDTDTPMPGVDPELFELSVAKLETKSANNVTDAFSKLMESVEKNSTVTRKLQSNGEKSEEACQVISLLPDLSFMRARVLMFPSTLTPAAHNL